MWNLLRDGPEGVRMSSTYTLYNFYFHGVLITEEVRYRAQRLKARFGRDNYIEEWALWQRRKALL